MLQSVDGNIPADLSEHRSKWVKDKPQTAWQTQQSGYTVPFLFVSHLALTWVLCKLLRWIPRYVHSCTYNCFNLPVAFLGSLEDLFYCWWNLVLSYFLRLECPDSSGPSGPFGYFFGWWAHILIEHSCSGHILSSHDSTSVVLSHARFALTSSSHLKIKFNWASCIFTC